MSNNSAIIWLGVGWTMLHFLWVGAVLAAMAAVVMRTFRAASAEVRYGLALASLVFLALVPPAIAWRLRFASGSEWSGRLRSGADQAGSAVASPVLVAGRDRDGPGSRAAG